VSTRSPRSPATTNSARSGIATPNASSPWLRALSLSYIHPRRPRASRARDGSRESARCTRMGNRNREPRRRFATQRPPLVVLARPRPLARGTRVDWPGARTERRLARGTRSGSQRGRTSRLLADRLRRLCCRAGPSRWVRPQAS
jgi:hypothetical protein